MGMENCYHLSSTISTTTTTATTTVAAVTHHHHHICYFQNKKLNLSKSNLSSSRNSFSSQHHKSNIVCKANDAIHPGLPPSLSVNPDLGFNSVKKNYTHLENRIPSARLFPAGTSKHWFAQMEKPMDGALTKAQMVDHFVRVLSRVLGNEVDAQMCIYHVSWQSNYGLGCELDEECAEELNGLPGIISVKPDLDFKFVNTDYIAPKIHTPSVDLFPSGNSKHWLVRMEKPMVGVVTKAQMVDHYVNILTKVMGNEVDAQMCIYHVSWQFNFGFCCELNDECARELTDVPGVLSVQLDETFESISKSYEGDTIQNSAGALDSSKGNETVNVKTKKLFITGLSFYTSEKTLRAAFEGFGELVEVKIIIDKISKRSRGYAFIEYKTEAAAGAALKEMNGKIINGWMIVVDVAKTIPPKYSQGRPITTN